MVPQAAAHQGPEVAEKVVDLLTLVRFVADLLQEAPDRIAPEQVRKYGNGRGVQVISLVGDQDQQIVILSHADERFDPPHELVDPLHILIIGCG
jgi:F420-0:gamma-glutamyl ligase-like protein